MNFFSAGGAKKYDKFVTFSPINVTYLYVAVVILCK